jgi:hypothetical protein
LKGVKKVFRNGLIVGCKPAVRSIGTKRRRAVNSGADELLDEEGSEDEEDEKHKLTWKGIVRTLGLLGAQPPHHMHFDELMK